MNLTNSLIVAIRALQRNKLRTALTSIGIIIGVSSVIMMVGIGNSARIAVRERIYSFGTNAMALMSFKHSFTAEDLNLMREEIPEIQYITPANYFEYPVKHRSKSGVKTVMGASNDYFYMNNWTTQSGSLFTPEEIMGNEKVVIVGNSIKRDLFDDQDPVGLVIHIMGIPFKIVGCLEEKGVAISGRDLDAIIVGPYTTMSLKLFPAKNIVSVYASTYTEEQIEPVKDKLFEWYRRRNSLPEGDTADFRIATSRDALRMAEEISNILTSLLAGIASISLFVGGVGIMNIMLVSVSERTREIGIRMAIGAKNRDILLQFLVESVLISSMGGIIGITLGILIYWIITFASKQPFIFSAVSIIVSFIFATSVGIVFGYYPARKASLLNPIDALRHE